MTSVNELNGYQRGLEEGRRQGEAIGRTKAYQEARRLGITVRAMKLTIAFVIGFMLAVAVQANAETAQTSLEVRVGVTAEVACGPENCPTWEDIEAVSVEPEPTWWERMVEWMQRLIT